MPLTSAERTSYLVDCPRCGQTTEKPVAWLVTQDTLPCASPGCGHLIDLLTPKNAVLVQKLADQSADLDAFLAKRD